jgi:hypothetical protein
MAAFTVLFGLFITGYAFEDAGGWTAVGSVAVWLVPLLVLTAVAYLWPDVARWVLLGVVALVSAEYLYGAVDPQGMRTVMDTVGPVLGISAFVLGMPLATLGWHRPAWGGGLLVATTALVFGSFLLVIRGEPWLGLGAALTTSSTVVCTPFLVVGVLLLIAAAVGHRGPEQRNAQPPAPTPVGAGAA